MTEPSGPLRMERLQQIRRDMEALHASALAERRGKTFTTSETLRQIDAAAPTDEITILRSKARPS